MSFQICGILSRGRNTAFADFKRLISLAGGDVRIIIGKMRKINLDIVIFVIRRDFRRSDNFFFVNSHRVFESYFRLSRSIGISNLRMDIINRNVYRSCVYMCAENKLLNVYSNEENCAIYHVCF